MNKLFEAVPVSEKPEKAGWYQVMNKLHETCGSSNFDGSYWGNVHAAFWLKPIPPPTKEAEQRAKELYPDLKNNMGIEVDNTPLRAAYLKGHQEASTGQEGEAKVLRDAVKYVSESIVLDTYESWCIHVKSICRKALRESSTPSHTVEDDWVRVEDEYPEKQRIVLTHLAESKTTISNSWDGSEWECEINGSKDFSHWRHLPPNPRT